MSTFLLRNCCHYDGSIFSRCWLPVCLKGSEDVGNVYGRDELYGPCLLSVES